MPYRLSPAPPIPYGMHVPAAATMEPTYRELPGVSIGGLALRGLVAVALSIGALFASDQLYKAVRAPASAWVAMTFSQDRATAQTIVGVAIAATATLLVTLTVLLVSTRRRG